MKVLLTNFFLFFIPVIALRHPIIGLLGYYWFSLMALTPAFIGRTGMPWGDLLVGSTVIGYMLSKNKAGLKLEAPLVSMLAFAFWTFVTCFFANHPEVAWSELTSFLKIVGVVILLILLVDTKEKLHALLWIICIAIGFNTLTGGITTLISQHNIAGTRGTIYGTENVFARAALMSIPLFVLISLQSRKKYVKIGAGVAALLDAMSLVGSGSRGGFIGALAMGAWAWLDTQKKFRSTAIVGIIAIVGFVSISDQVRVSWFERMETIQGFEEEKTANQRFDTWRWAAKTAAERPITGGGFGAFLDNTHIANNGKVEFFLGHSNYFQALGEHGYVGLILYLWMCLAVWRSLHTIVKQTKEVPEHRYHHDFARMLQLSLIGYLVGGLTITHTYYELFYILVGMTVALSRLTRGPGSETAIPNASGRS